VQNKSALARRIEISLDDELYERASSRAQAMGVSLEEDIRWLVMQALPEQKRQADISAIFGLGDSGGTNIAKDKHRLIGEAIAAEKIGQ
jgi:hypothetical protein